MIDKLSDIVGNVMAVAALIRRSGNLIDVPADRRQLSTMAGKNVHTVRSTTGKGWVNKVGGEIASRHRTQENAAERGREIARENNSEHAIHRRDGTIGEKNSYGNDPNPPRDKNR